MEEDHRRIAFHLTVRIRTAALHICVKKASWLSHIQGKGVMVGVSSKKNVKRMRGNSFEIQYASAICKYPWSHLLAKKTSQSDLESLPREAKSSEVFSST